jgi:hypothetical protein
MNEWRECTKALVLVPFILTPHIPSLCAHSVTHLHFGCVEVSRCLPPPHTHSECPQVSVSSLRGHLSDGLEHGLQQEEGQEKGQEKGGREKEVEG